MKAITIPSLDFTDVHVEDVLLFLTAAGRRYSSQGQDVDISLLGMDRVPKDNTVSISFADMNLYDALELVVEMTSLKYEIGPHVISVMPANYVPLSQMIPKSYDISPEVGTDMANAGTDDSGTVDLFGGTFTDEPGMEPVDVKDFFSVVDFPEGSSAVYQPRFNKLSVLNTPKNLSALEDVLAGLEEEALKLRSQQVAIEAKFVEFSEGALEELGFDWTAYGSGTAAGFGFQDDNTYYFQGASGYVDDPTITLPRQVYPRLPQGSGSFVSVPGSPVVYQDSRSGQQLIYDPTAPDDWRLGQNVYGAHQRSNSQVFDPTLVGVLATMGGNPAAMVLSNDEIDLKITALEQQGTADILSAPRITVKSGSEALIRVAETHRYPQSWNVETGQRTPPITQPQDWEDFDLGVSLRVTPVVDADKSSIDLNIFPQILAFKGFDDYFVAFNTYDIGSNNNPETAGDGKKLFTLLPYFERRSAESEVTVADGGTVVLGGLINERTENFRDQVPFLGDVPFLGRLFRTEGSRNVKVNLTIYVTAKQIDSKGMTRAERELARR
jgi:general secretion pathway protein D